MIVLKGIQNNNLNRSLNPQKKTIPKNLLFKMIMWVKALQLIIVFNNKKKTKVKWIK